MALQPFSWGANGQKATPSSVKKYAEIAAALANKTGAPKNLGEGLNSIGEALLAKSYEGRAAAGEQEGAASRKAIMDALMGNADPTMQDLAGAMGNEWVTSDPGSSAIVQALLGQEIQQNDPMRQMQMEKMGLELDALRNPSAPAPDFGWQTMPDGTLIRTDGTTGEITPMGAFPKPDDGVTDTQANLIWRAEQAGLVPGTPEYAEFMRSGGQSTGMSLSVGPDGTVQLSQGPGAGKPLTENQSKLTLFQSLQTETQPVLLDLETQFNPGNIADATARSTPIAGNFFQSEQGQIYNSAATAWAEGALRIATGAAATPEEMERTKRAYFAQPGDTPNTIAFKAQMREMYNRAIQRSLGQETTGALPKPSDFAQQVSAGSAAVEPDQSKPPVITQQDYQALPSGSPFIAADDPTQTIRIKP